MNNRKHFIKSLEKHLHFIRCRRVVRNLHYLLLYVLYTVKATAQPNHLFCFAAVFQIDLND